MDPSNNLDKGMLIGKMKTKYGPSRGSKYRGVTLNGDKWQVLFTILEEYIYLCSTPNEKQAATLYDISMIQNRGLKALVSMEYSKAHLLGILFEKSLVHMRK